MGKRATSAVNVTLTNYAQGLSQDVKSNIADFIAPRVRVPATIGQFKKYDSKNAFQVYETARAIGGSATRIKFDATDPTYNCKPQALEIAIDDAERDAAGADDSALQQSKVRTVVINAHLGHEDKVMTAMKAGVSAVGSRGVWSSSSNDPVQEIDEQIDAIATACGMMPNAILFGMGAWRVFRNHPKVIARFPGAASIGVTMDQALGLFLNPQMLGKVGILSKDTTKFGNTKSASNIVGAEVFIFLRSDNPTLYDPSFAKTFMGGENSIEAVREYRDESARSDVFAIDWSEDIQVVSTEAAKRLTIS